VLSSAWSRLDLGGDGDLKDDGDRQESRMMLAGLLILMAVAGVILLITVLLGMPSPASSSLLARRSIDQTEICSSGDDLNPADALK
jgi:hypothetical protein